MNQDMSTSSKISDREQFISEYCRLYELHFGGRYLFNGGKDGSAVKRFLDYGFPVEEAMEILADAFTRTGYPFDGCTTIAGFVSNWPRLLAERAKKQKLTRARPLSRFEIRQMIDIIKLRISNHPHNPDSIRYDRNTLADMDYEDLKKKLRRLEDQLISI